MDIIELKTFLSHNILVFAISIFEIPYLVNLCSSTARAQFFIRHHFRLVSIIWVHSMALYLHKSQGFVGNVCLCVRGVPNT